MGSADLIPDRRRIHFPLNGGPRPSDEDKDRGHRGAQAARAVLDATVVPPPAEPAVVRQLAATAIGRARRGLAAARDALQRSEPDDSPHA